jgi:glycosyltransferase involved in cell wall biosynthesis
MRNAFVYFWLIMKIIYVHTEPWISNSPGVTFITYNALGIAQNHIETHLIVVNNSAEETDVLLQQVFDTARPASLSIHRLDASSHWRFYRQAIALITRLLDDHTTIVTRAISFLPHLLWFRHHHHCKILYESHDFYWDLRQRPNIKKRKKWKHSLYESLFIPRTDGLICLQKTQKNLYRRYLPENFPIAVLRTGIYRLWASDIPSRQNVLAYIGSLDQHKGIDNVFKLARHLDNDYTIQIFGGKTETEMEIFRDLLSQEGLSERIHLTGWLTKSELHRSLTKVKWGLIPLHNTFFNAYLTSPLKLFDFYAHGIPVLVSDLPTLRELVEPGKTGFFVDWTDEASIVRALQISDQEYATMVNHILQRVQDELLWKQRGQHLLEFVSTL